MTPDLVLVKFESITFTLFGGLVKKTSAFDQSKPKRIFGSWKILYLDEDLRILRTNKKNVVVMKRT